MKKTTKKASEYQDDTRIVYSELKKGTKKPLPFLGEEIRLCQGRVSKRDIKSVYIWPTRPLFNTRRPNSDIIFGQIGFVLYLYGQIKMIMIGRKREFELLQEAHQCVSFFPLH